MRRALSLAVSLAPICSIAVVSAACHRSTPVSDTPDGATAASIADASAPSTVVDAAAPAPAMDGARAVVLAWSRALDTHDVTALSALYADHVRLYGRDLPKSAVLVAKQRALSAKSTFRQKIIGDVTLTALDPTNVQATFRKQSGSNGKFSEVPAKLVLVSPDAGPYVIREETDDVTEKAHVEARCEEQAALAVNALPSVKAIVASGRKAADESDGGQYFGGIGPMVDENGGFTAGIGMHTAERFEAEVWYSVDAGGNLTVTVLGADEPVSPGSLAAVQRACHR